MADTELLLSALENLPSFVIVDDTARIVYINENYVKILGIRHMDAIGKPVEEIIPRTRLAIVVKNGIEETGRLMNFFDHSTGKNITLVCSRYPIRKGGKVIGAIGTTTIKDIHIVASLYEEIQALNREKQQYKERLKNLDIVLNPLDNLIGSSRRFIELKKSVLDYAVSNLAILLTGETGTGKELVAKVIHQLSGRNQYNYIKINCAAIPASLLESELFGYAAGAFTGAVRTGKIGKYELAHNGTLLLDEIGEMPLELQAKLLRVLQEGEFEPVGSNHTKKADVRLLCSTNRDLEDMVAQGLFRADLYYRINVVEIRIPSLRERIEDIESLCRYFIQHINNGGKYQIIDIDENVLRRFSAYNWPGNIRELEHVIERATVINKDSILRENDFDFFWNRISRPETISKSADGQDNLKYQLMNTEKQAIMEVLQKTGGNKTKAAKILNVDRTTLYSKLRRYNLM